MSSQSKRVQAPRRRLPTWSDLHELLRGRLRRYFLKEAILRRDRPDKAKRFDSETITHILDMTFLFAYGERNLVNNLYQEWWTTEMIPYKQQLEREALAEIRRQSLRSFDVKKREEEEKEEEEEEDEREKRKRLERERVECKKCKRTFKTTETKNRHEAQCNGPPRNTFPCTHCLKTANDASVRVFFSSMRALQRHQDSESCCIRKKRKTKGRVSVYDSWISTRPWPRMNVFVYSMCK